ncbi:MAG: tetratricopeptide repeat protein [Cyclobacteriaceae bacterium]
MEILQQTLLKALANPSAISLEDQELLKKASAEFPYFQLAHTLVAKAKHDQQAPDAYESLGLAAIHAPDRRHLRKVFYEDVHIQWQPAENEVDATEAVIVPPTAEEPEVFETPTTETDAVAPQETEENSVVPEPEEEEPKEAETSGVANHDEEEEAVYRELEENLRNLRKAKEESQKDEDEDKKKIVETTDEASATVNGNATSDQPPQSPILLDDLHNIGPLTSEHLGIQQQKQNELISKFVNSDTNSIGRLQPTMSDDDKHAQDLSEKSSAYDEGLVTENLAEIMLRQGKKEKSVKIYEQLILKYPQKKAYFAAKIEQIKQQ